MTQAETNSHASLIQDEIANALIGATDDGAYLGYAQVREAENGQLVADVYTDEGDIIATYPLAIVVGDRIG
ncbi:hypothetical protein [Microbacterium sp. 77mftsu3.1]|uniref:hypothetical protein n=1 Tax=Microbacterium sp. 77mftsu3.1 TaxID=1761802 RepID=UPI0003639C56|nr:hypothetical protein [Microbacterium sp. 77mftsu3.1]SDH43268.1 hypothetical protein SAMN04488590_3331 [Microbacterium sp. 77mftsu3.1]